MRNLPLSLLFGLYLLFPAYAQSQSIPAPSLVGLWSASEQIPNGPMMSTSVTLTADMQFKGEATIQGKVFWTYSGTWQVAGRQLTWHYEISSKPLPESAKTDIDDIKSVDATRLVLISRTRGKEHEFKRAN